jgi:hypothetical protein
VIGWENVHIYLFRLTINKQVAVYGLPGPAWVRSGIQVRNSRRAKLEATVRADWLKLTYEYDLGDRWMRQITIEKIENLAADQIDGHTPWITPRCLAGERACPPVIWRIICQEGPIGKFQHLFQRGLRPGRLAQPQKSTPLATRSRPRSTRLCLGCPGPQKLSLSRSKCVLLQASRMREKLSRRYASGCQRQDRDGRATHNEGARGAPVSSRDLAARSGQGSGACHLPGAVLSCVTSWLVEVH